MSGSTLLTSDYYLQESIRTIGSTAQANIALFDEQQMIDQSNRQTQREEYVRKALRGYGSMSPLKNQQSPSSKSTRFSDFNKEARARQLQNQINEVVAERERIVAEGEAEVRKVMEQLKREQEEFEAEQKKQQEQDDLEFKREIERLSNRLEQCSKPMREITERVRGQSGSIEESSTISTSTLNNSK